jgi:hypothetical protein
MTTGDHACASAATSRARSARTSRFAAGRGRCATLRGLCAKRSAEPGWAAVRHPRRHVAQPLHGAPRRHRYVAIHADCPRNPRDERHAIRSAHRGSIGRGRAAPRRAAPHRQRLRADEQLLVEIDPHRTPRCAPAERRRVRQHPRIRRDAGAFALIGPAIGVPLADRRDTC